MGPKLSSFLAGLLVGVALTAGIAALVVRLTGSGGGGAAVVPTNVARELRLAHSLPTDHPVHRGLVRFAELVEERSDGRLSVVIFPNGELGGETTNIEQLQNGTLDIAKASAAPLGSFQPDFGVFSIPYTFSDADHFWRTLNGDVGRERLASLEQSGLHGLCYMDAGARSFYTSGDPILTPDDVQGLKVRVMESRTAMDMIRSFGGAPTPMAFAELYSALQSGLVDAAENNPPSFLSSRHYEVAKNYTLNEHARVPDVLLISGRTWQRLDPALQDIIQRSADDASVYQRELWAQREVEALAAVEEFGVTIHRPDPAPFAQMVTPMLREYDGTRIGELLSRIQSQR